jgi:hypothetical protein
MKLYTEEQVKQAISSFSATFFVSTDELLEELKLTPIELPSEEELSKEGLLIFESKGYNIYTHYNQVPIWIEGAKWVINQIKQQEK